MRNKKWLIDLFYRTTVVRLLLCLIPSTVLGADHSASGPPDFRVTIQPGLVTESKSGRLFVVISRDRTPEPRLALSKTGPEAPYTLARDLKSFNPGTAEMLDKSSFIFPITNLAALPSGDYFLQAVFDTNPDLRSANSPGNLYSSVQKHSVSGARSESINLVLDHQVPAEQLPAESQQIKFIKLHSKLLSEFYGRPIFLRAGIVLPRNYEAGGSQRYPLWIRIGGFNTRYTTVNRLLVEGSDFRTTWMADNTPRFILLQLDGAGPYGDPYQVNSANSGPYGDAVVTELIPFVESKFRAIGNPRARVLSGTSTGGWVSLALQIFYPEFFNGAWSSCPDPVDFRAFQLVNIYEDDNAYSNKHGNERPSERDLKGDIALTMRREVAVENLLGRGNSYVISGQQWGAWNVVFGPRGADGTPVPLWDPQSGKIDHEVARQWRKYDLRLVLKENWKDLGPKLRGKLHIAAGESDQYFLNNAVHLLDEFFSQAEPPFEGRIAYGPGKGHGWFYAPLRSMLEEMQAATQEKKN